VAQTRSIEDQQLNAISLAARQAESLNLTKLNVSLLVPHTYLYSYLLNYGINPGWYMMVHIIILKVYNLGALFSAETTEVI
jgi:hypothetical protein